MGYLFVADESVDYRVITALREAGAEVFAIIENHPSILDPDVLEIARQMTRILITEDKDFGDLIFRLKLPHEGVILLRYSEILPEEFGSVAGKILELYPRLLAAFSVFTERKIRIRNMDDEG